MSRRKWVRSSLRHLSGLLRGRGVPLCRGTVGRLLKGLGFSLRANEKRLTGPPHPDRDRQLGYIQRTKRRFLKAGLPVISVDAKKKELVGDFKNAGRAWRRETDPVNAHDFRQDASHRAAPYGLYDLTHNRGHVAVGTSADTAEFAVDAIAGWWEEHGSKAFPGAGQILILADAGGSNGCRNRLWKLRLQEHLVDRLGLCVTVCHYPRGASKWNPVEHRLFGPISVNWSGKPLRCLGTLLGYIRGTATATGLEVTAKLLERTYVTKIKVSKREMEGVRLIRHKVCPNWNYTLRRCWGSVTSQEGPAR
jgi:Rhodopirellula transposase DDE domain